MAAHRLPSLKGLQAFEAFARVGSMVRAAEELGVTHGAVSRQIKALERQLAAKLLAGPKHRLVLTPAGGKLADAVSVAFTQISAALPGAREDEELVISVPGAFAMKWLIPRLADFATSHPEVKVRVVEGDGLVDFGHGGINAAIRLHAGPAPEGTRVTAFLDHAFGPVLAPALFDKTERQALRTLSLPRLRSETFPEGWARWAKAATLDLPPASPEHVFEHNTFMLEAAAAGLGVAITAQAFAQPDIEQGRLVAPWGFCKLPTRFCLLRPALMHSAPLEQLAQWLSAEGRQRA